MRGKLLLFCSFIGCSFFTPVFSQTDDIKLNAEKIRIYAPYVEASHGLSGEAFEAWKNTNKLQYTKELWYYTESFYIKKKHSKSGVSMDPAHVDISRYEKHRKQNQEFTLEIAGFCDAIVLLPVNKLIYKP